MSTKSMVGAVLALIAVTTAGFGMFWGVPPDPPPRPDTPTDTKTLPGAKLSAPPARHRFTVLLTKEWPWPHATRCAFLDNDHILVQPGVPGVLEVRDAETGKLLKTESIDKQFVGDFRLSADRKWVAP